MQPYALPSRARASPACVVRIARTCTLRTTGWEIDHGWALWMPNLNPQIPNRSVVAGWEIGRCRILATFVCGLPHTACASGVREAYISCFIVCARPNLPCILPSSEAAGAVAVLHGQLQRMLEKCLFARTCGLFHCSTPSFFLSLACLWT